MAQSGAAEFISQGFPSHREKVMNKVQLSVMDALLSGLDEKIDPDITITVDNSRAPVVMSPIAVDDIAAGIFATFGGLAATLGKMKGLPAQSVLIDRRHSGNTLNSIAWHFQNTYQLDLSPVHTDVNGFYPTADGRHVIYNGAYPHLREIVLEYLGCPNKRDLIARATHTHKAADLEYELSRRGACVAIVRDRSEWARHDQGQYLTSVGVIELVKVAEALPVPLPAGRRILAGIKVLDLTKVIAGPTAGRQFAEHGADVIHVHHPYEDFIYAMDIDTSYGKTNSYLDFNREKDRAILINLIKDADIFLDGYRYGALEQHGLGVDDVVKINKNIINLRMNAYGFGGPWARRRGFEQLAQSTTGAAAIQGGSLATPKLIPAYMNDYLSGYLAALGTVAALIKRAREGGAWLVRVSLARTCTFALEHGLGEHEAPKPAEQSELRSWMIDQEGQLGLMTRLRPVIAYSHTPVYAAIAGTAPGSHLPRWGGVTDPGTVPHHPTRVFEDLRFLGAMSLH
jgi:crotonobetainyl-CoA:carnitine CoA-transferase CaiB-like acyl-CoA transferase